MRIYKSKKNNNNELLQRKRKQAKKQFLFDNAKDVHHIRPFVYMIYHNNQENIIGG